MLRDEQITEALESYQYKYDNGSPESVTTYNEGYDDGFEVGFVEGAKWADNNPNWHKYPDEKPNKNGLYLLYYVGGGHTLSMWKKNEFLLTDYEAVAAWIELPNSPKFD